MYGSLLLLETEKISVESSVCLCENGTNGRKLQDRARLDEIEFESPTRFPVSPAHKHRHFFFGELLLLTGFEGDSTEKRFGGRRKKKTVYPHTSTGPNERALVLVGRSNANFPPAPALFLPTSWKVAEKKGRKCCFRI